MSKSIKKTTAKPQASKSPSSAERKPVLSIIKDIQSVRRCGLLTLKREPRLDWLLLSISKGGTIVDGSILY